MKSATPFVSIIIPMRNEERYIATCLYSVLEQDYPRENMEILVVDGMSTDNSREIVNDIADKEASIALLSNPEKIVPTALNAGIKIAKGELIVRMDAHTKYADDYVSKCVEYSLKTDADNVGGPIETLPGADTAIANSIAIVTSHPFGVGNSKFRCGGEEGLVDTVTFGAFKREVFDRVGLYNEKLVRNQDIELNARIRKNGGKIFMTPAIKSYYYNCPTLQKLWQQNFRNGYWNVLTQKISPGSLSYRHFIPFLFVLSLLCSFAMLVFAGYGLFFYAVILSYLIPLVTLCVGLSLKHGAYYFPLLIATFSVLHISYGIGFMWGLARLPFLRDK